VLLLLSRQLPRCQEDPWSTGLLRRSALAPCSAPACGQLGASTGSGMRVPNDGCSGAGGGGGVPGEPRGEAKPGPVAQRPEHGPRSREQWDVTRGSTGVGGVR